MLRASYWTGRVPVRLLRSDRSSEVPLTERPHRRSQADQLLHLRSAGLLTELHPGQWLRLLHSNRMYSRTCRILSL